MEEYIINILEKYDLKYVKIENENSLEKIYNLFKNNIFEEPSTDVEYYYYGNYYDEIEENYDLMKKYYLMAIELNHSYAMYNLAQHYQYPEKNYELMKKYYLMAIELNHSYAMYNLASYYGYTEKNYDLMKKYFLMAIELNNSNAMYWLADYYKYTEKNYDLMKKYYLMAIELNDSDAMYDLGQYYENTEDNYDSSFVELYKYEDKEDIIKLFNNKFKNNINLDQKYYYSFLQWKSENRSNTVKIKQYILRKTNIFPKYYNEKYLNHFNIIVNLKNVKLPKDILNLIAGHLFNYPIR